MKKVINLFSIVICMSLLQSFTITPDSIVTSNPITNSKIVWKAYKVTGSHEGTVDLLSGSLTFDKDQLVGGEFNIDMSSIQCTDLSGEYAGKLEGHLKSDDFFGVSTYKNASMKITETTMTGKNSYQLKGDLTIKGITKSIDFQVSVYGKKATANIKIDRTHFGIKYGSGSFFDDLKDNMIYDEFDLIVDLEF